MTHYSRVYDDSYEPSAPVMDVTLSSTGRMEPMLSLTALVDSGADGILIPLDILQELQAPYWGTRQMVGITGGRIRVDLYTVTLGIGSHLLHGIHVVAVRSGAEPLLGRDVLNQLRIILDGPAATVEIA